MVPVRLPALRAVPVIAAAGTVALAAAITACGSTGSGSATTTRMAGTAHASAAPVSHQASSPAAPSPAGTARLTGAAATALADKAVTNTENAASVRVSGHAVSTGSGSQAVSFDLVLVKNDGCAGTIALSKAETFRIVETGGYVWMLPTEAFYSSLHPRLSQAALALVADKYIRVKSSDKQIADLAQICTFNGLFGGSAKPAGTAYTATPGTYHGTPVYLLSQAGQAGTAVIANAATPLMLKLTDPSSGGGTITFTGYGAVTKITRPGDAETIDGSKLGV